MFLTLIEFLSGFMYTTFLSTIVQLLELCDYVWFKLLNSKLNKKYNLVTI